MYFLLNMVAQQIIEIETLFPTDFCKAKVLTITDRKQDKNIIHYKPHSIYDTPYVFAHNLPEIY